jgi:protoporphyrinogen oxidase
MDRKKVVIIGGGCAGLSAAYTLKKKGIDFVLLESTGRTGGRVGNREKDGFHYAIGAAMTEPQWKTTFTYLNELGLSSKIHPVEKQCYAFWNNGKKHYLTLGKGMSLKSLLGFRGMPFKTYPQTLKFMAAIKRYKPVNPDGSHNFGSLAEISTISTAEFGLKHGGAQLVNHILNPFLGTMTLARASDVSIAHPIALLALMKGMCYLEGGLGALTDALYEQVKDNVKLSTSVKKVVIENNQVKGVETSAGFIEADQVLCTTDAFLTQQIIPDLPQAVKKALKTCNYSSSYHYAFGLKKRIVPDYYLSLMIPASENSILSTVFDENSKAFGQRAPEGTGMMHAFTGGWHDAELSSLSEADRTRRVIKEMQKFFPDFPDQPLFTDVMRYDRAINLESPGQFIAIQDLIQHHMNDITGLHLAGEYLFLIASTEGALETGESAAEKIALTR